MASICQLLNLPEIPDRRHISLAQNQSFPSVPFQKRTLFERSTTLRDDRCCSHAYMLRNMNTPTFSLNIGPAKTGPAGPLAPALPFQETLITCTLSMGSEYKAHSNHHNHLGLCCGPHDCVVSGGEKYGHVGQVHLT